MGTDSLGVWAEEPDEEAVATPPDTCSTRNRNVQCICTQTCMHPTTQAHTHDIKEYATADSTVSTWLGLVSAVQHTHTFGTTGLYAHAASRRST